MADFSDREKGYERDFERKQELAFKAKARRNHLIGLWAAQQLGLAVKEKLTGQLEGESSSPLLGYQVTQKLIASGDPFSALFAFNDISAIGAIHALREAGYRVPEDVSVVGFDDIQSAAFQNPALTTVRQPLREMGLIAAETLLRRITAPAKAPYPQEIVVEPEFVVRGSTAPFATNTRPGTLRA